MDCSLPGSAVHGIFQARVLEWGALAFSAQHTEMSSIPVALVGLKFPPPVVLGTQSRVRCLILLVQSDCPMIWLGLLETHKPRQQVAWLKSWSQADFVLRGLDTQPPGSQCPQQQLGGGDSQEGMAPNFMLLSDSGLVALLPLWLSWQIICLQRGDLSSIPALGRSSGEGKGYPLQYSGLENSMDHIVHGVAKKSDMTEQLSLSLSFPSTPPLPKLSLSAFSPRY